MATGVAGPTVAGDVLDVPRVGLTGGALYEGVSGVEHH